MTVRDRILAQLRSHPDGIDDDALTGLVGLTRRQHTNQECRKLEAAGLVCRRRVNGRIRNFLKEGVGIEAGTQIRAEDASQPFQPDDSTSVAGKSWSWEGNVQRTVSQFLQTRGYEIKQEANTLTKEHGKDIIAVASSGRELWITAKGKPEGTLRTTPYTQARHYFTDALHDAVYWRSLSKDDADLAMALPEFVNYRNLAAKLESQLRELRCSVLWVSQIGDVEAAPNFL